MLKDIKIAIPCLALAFLLSLSITVLFTAKPAEAGWPVDEFMLTVNVSHADGNIAVNQTIPASYPATFIFTDDESIRLEAIPPAGYYFTNWSGGISNPHNPVIMMMNCNKSIMANFSPIMHTLTINVNGSGSSSPEAGEYSYPEGTVVRIAATPDDGWKLDNWTGDVIEQDSATILLIIDSDKTIAANFSEIMPVPWLIASIIAGILVIGVIIWLFIMKRNALNQVTLKCRSNLKCEKKK